MEKLLVLQDVKETRQKLYKWLAVTVELKV